MAQQAQATFGLAFLAVLPIVTFAALQLSGCEPQLYPRACEAEFADALRSCSMATVRAIEAARSTGSFSAASFFAMLANGVAWCAAARCRAAWLSRPAAWHRGLYGWLKLDYTILVANVMARLAKPRMHAPVLDSVVHTQCAVFGAYYVTVYRKYSSVTLQGFYLGTVAVVRRPCRVATSLCTAVIHATDCACSLAGAEQHAGARRAQGRLAGQRPRRGHDGLAAGG